MLVTQSYRLFVRPWTVTCPAPLSMGFCRQKYWSGLSCPPPGDLFNPGIEPRSPSLQADSFIWATREAQKWGPALSEANPTETTSVALAAGVYHSPAAAAKSLQSCPTLCDSIDGSPPGSPVPGILPARTLEWVAISFSNAWKWKGKVKSLSRVRLLETPWTAAYQAPPSMGFSRQEYCSGVPLPSPSFP